MTTEVKLLFIEPIPVYKTSVPLYLFDLTKKNITTPITQTQDAVKTNYSKYEASHTALKRAGAYLLDPVPILCTPVCQISDLSGKPYYFDHHHRTLTGADFLKDSLKSSLSSILSN